MKLIFKNFTNNIHISKPIAKGDKNLFLTWVTRVNGSFSFFLSFDDERSDVTRNSHAVPNNKRLPESDNRYAGGQELYEGKFCYWKQSKS